MTLVCGLSNPAAAVYWTSEATLRIRGCSGHQGASYLGFQHVRIHRQTVALGEVVECGEVLKADTLRRRDGHRGANPVIGKRHCHVFQQVVVGLEQLVARRRARVHQMQRG